MMNNTISFVNFGLYYSNEVLAILVALLALLITFIAVSIPTMILTTAGFQTSFFDVVINPECRKTIKKDALICDIKELSERILENALFMNLIYRITWWSTIIAIILVLLSIIVIPILSLHKYYLIYSLVIIVVGYMLMMLLVFAIVPKKMLKGGSKGSYPKLAKIQNEIIDEIYDENSPDNNIGYW